MVGGGRVTNHRGGSPSAIAGSTSIRTFSARGQPTKLATATDSGNCSPGPIAQVRQTTRVGPSSSSGSSGASGRMCEDMRETAKGKGTLATDTRN